MCTTQAFSVSAVLQNAHHKMLIVGAGETRFLAMLTTLSKEQGMCLSSAALYDYSH
jgi:hypothetical protein